MYLGHHPDGSGVQLHSVGSHYPLVLQVREGLPSTATPFYVAEVIDTMGNVVHAEFLGGQTTRDARIEARGRARVAAERLAGLYASARASR